MPNKRTGKVLSSGMPVDLAIVLSDDCAVLKALGLQEGQEGHPRDSIWFAPVIDASNRDAKTFEGVMTGFNFSRHGLPSSELDGTTIECRIVELRYAFRVNSAAVNAALKRQLAKAEKTVTEEADEPAADGRDEQAQEKQTAPTQFVLNRIDDDERERLQSRWAASTARYGMLVSGNNIDKFKKYIRKHGVGETDAENVAQALFNVSQSARGYEGTALENAGDAEASQESIKVLFAQIRAALERLKTDADSVLALIP